MLTAAGAGGPADGTKGAGRVIGLPEDDGWAEELGWLRALDAGRPHESGGGGSRRGGRGGQDASDGRDERDRQRRRGGANGRGEAGEPGDDDAGRPEDRPWTPIPRQAKAAERGLIPTQRRLKKTSRSA